MQKIIYPVLLNEDLPFYLTGIGVCDPENNIVRDKGLISHQFLVTLEGEGVFEAEGEMHLLSKGCCLYLSPGVPHKYYVHYDSWKTAWLVFRGNMIDETMKKLGFGKLELGSLRDTAEFLRLFDMIFAAAQGNINVSEKSSVYIYEMALEVRKQLLLEKSRLTEAPDIVLQTVNYIDHNFCRDITLGELAENAKVSSQHLCRMFKKRMNMRPVEYLNKKRISVSKALLLEGEKSITEISREVGFSSPTYFGMVFKNQENVSPSQFREQFLNKL